MVRALASIFLATRRHGPNVEYRPTAKEHRWGRMDTTIAALKQRNLLALETFEMKSFIFESFYCKKARAWFSPCAEERPIGEGAAS